MPRAIKIGTLSRRWLTALAVGASLAMTPVQAAVVVQDKFDGETAGTTLNHNAPAQWDVLNGSIDRLAQPNGYGFGCLGGTGKCVNLDGSTADSLTVRFDDLGETFALAAGDPYTQVARIVTVGAASDRILFSPTGNDPTGHDSTGHDSTGHDDVDVLPENVVVRDVTAMREVDTRLLLVGGLGILVLIVAPQRFGSASQRRRRYRRSLKRA